MSIKKKIAIIGTSFAGYGCCNKLIENNITPTVFEYINNFNYSNILSNKTSIKDIFSQKNNFYLNNNFFGVGGLSNIWGGIVDYYSNKELLEVLNYNNKNDNFYSDKTFKKLNFKIRKINQTKILLKNNKLFSSKEYFNNLIKKKKINFLNDRVEKITFNKNNTIIHTLNKNYIFDYIFLCCGVKSTYNFLKPIFNIKSKIYFSQKFLIPTRIKKKFKNKNIKYPLFSFSFKNKNMIIAYIQVYDLEQIIYKIFKIRFLGSFNILQKFGICYISISSKNSDAIHLLSRKIYKNKKNSNVKKIIKSLFSHKTMLLYIKSYNFIFKLGPLSGNHYGSITPIKKKRSNNFEINRFCQPGNTNKISIFGNSILKYIPAAPPTLTIMIFAYHKTSEIIKKFIK